MWKSSLVDETDPDENAKWYEWEEKIARHEKKENPMSTDGDIVDFHTREVYE